MRVQDLISKMSIIETVICKVCGNPEKVRQRSILLLLEEEWGPPKDFTDPVIEVYCSYMIFTIKSIENSNNSQLEVNLGKCQKPAAFSKF